MSDVIDKPRTKIKELPKIIFYSDQTIYIKDVRASYPQTVGHIGDQREEVFDHRVDPEDAGISGERSGSQPIHRSVPYR
jgi:hypothetical protein